MQLDLYKDLPFTDLDRTGDLTVVHQQVRFGQQVDSAKRMIWGLLLQTLSKNNSRVDTTSLYKELELETMKCFNARFKIKPHLTRSLKHIQKNWRKWVSSAILALLHLHRGKHYTVSKDPQKRLIQVIDQTNLLPKEGSVFAREVHCFLELKEGVRMSPELLP